MENGRGQVLRGRVLEGRAWCALSARVDAPAVPTARLSPMPRAPAREQAPAVRGLCLVRDAGPRTARQDDLKRNVACTAHQEDLVRIGKNPATGLTSEAARVRLAERS